MEITPDISAPRRAEVAPRDRLDGATIIVVEDEALLAHDLASTIEESGGRTEGPILRLADAMAVRDLDGLDAALLDVDIAGFEVFAFADRLKAAGIPIVFQTARSDAARLCARYPGAGIIYKPCLARGVVAALHSVIFRPGSSPLAAS